MIYLAISIVTAASLVVILKLFTVWHIPQRYGIVYNYLTCAAIGWIASDVQLQPAKILKWDATPLALLLGAGFFATFNIIAASSRYLGVSKTTIAFKLSFIIPVTAAIVIYKESFTWVTIVAILCAVLSVLIISTGNKASEDTQEDIPKYILFFPVLIFLASGANDTFFNYIQDRYMTEGYGHILTALIFSGAAIAGLLTAAYRKTFWTFKYLLGGIFLGIPNYASLYFLLLALEHSAMPYSRLFAVFNIGIILTGTGMGMLIFRERPERNSYIGLALAGIALLLIGWAG